MIRRIVLYILFGLISFNSLEAQSQSFQIFDREGTTDYIEYMLIRDNTVLVALNSYDLRVRPIYKHVSSEMLSLDFKDFRLKASDSDSFKTKFPLRINAIRHGGSGDYFVISSSQNLQDENVFKVLVFDANDGLIMAKEYQLPAGRIALFPLKISNDSLYYLGGSIGERSCIWKFNNQWDSMSLKIFPNSLYSEIVDAFEYDSSHAALLHLNDLTNEQAIGGGRLSIINLNDFELKSSCLIELEKQIGLQFPKLRYSITFTILNDSIVFLMGISNIGFSINEMHDFETLGIFYDFRQCRVVKYFHYGIRGYNDYIAHQPGYVIKGNYLYVASTIHQFPDNDVSYLKLDKITFDGEIVKTAIYDNGDNPFATGIYDLQDGRLAVTGLTRWGFNESRQNRGYGFILLTDTLLNLPDITSNHEYSERVIGYFPNPFSNVIYLKGLPSSHWQCEITTTDGKRVHFGHLASNEAQIDLSQHSIPPGMYLLRLQSDNEVHIIKLLKQ